VYRGGDGRVQGVLPWRVLIVGLRRRREESAAVAGVHPARHYLLIQSRDRGEGRRGLAAGYETEVTARSLADDREYV